MLKIPYLILLFLLVPTLVGAQDTLVVQPGDPLINGSFIESYTNKWKVTLINAEGEETPNKIWTDYGQIIELDGTKYFHRVQDIYDPEMNILDTWINMADHATLAPVSFSSISPAGSYNYMQFDEFNVEIVTNRNKEEEKKISSIALSEAVFDWNLYGMLLVGLPLKEDLKVKMPILSPQTNTAGWLNASVEGQEDITTKNGEVISSWRVITNKKLTFWLVKTAPYVIKLKLDLPNESNLVWEIF